MMRPRLTLQLVQKIGQSSSVLAFSFHGNGRHYELLDVQTLTICLTDSDLGSPAVVHSPIVPPEIKLRNVAMEMLGAHVVKRAVHATLKAMRMTTPRCCGCRRGGLVGVVLESLLNPAALRVHVITS